VVGVGVVEGAGKIVGDEIGVWAGARVSASLARSDLKEV